MTAGESRTTQKDEERRESGTTQRRREKSSTPKGGGGPPLDFTSHNLVLRGGAFPPSPFWVVLLALFLLWAGAAFSLSPLVERSSDVSERRVALRSSSRHTRDTDTRVCVGVFPAQTQTRKFPQEALGSRTLLWVSLRLPHEVLGAEHERLPSLQPDTLLPSCGAAERPYEGETQRSWYSAELPEIVFAGAGAPV